MGVLNGQPVDQSVTNAAFINKNQDDSMGNKLSFTRVLSGSTIADIQQAVNNLYTATGVSETMNGTTYNAPPNTISNGDNYQTALGELAGKFAAATGHTHDGTNGNGPLLNVVRAIAASAFSNLTGDVLIAGGNGAQVFQSGQNILISATGHVDSIAASGSPGLNGNVTLIAGSGIQINQLGQNITFSATGSSGGGGGGALQWIEGLDSPTPLFENNIEVYGFDSGLTQQIFTTIKVPNSYTAGSQIRMRGLVYSSDTSGNLLFQTVATLIRTGTDAISSTTNQRTSTNSAITLGVGTANIPQAVTFDLSDSSGHINGVSVSAGDLIIIQLKRGSDTAASQARAMVFASEVTFV